MKQRHSIAFTSISAAALAAVLAAPLLAAAPIEQPLPRKPAPSPVHCELFAQSENEDFRAYTPMAYSIAAPPPVAHATMPALPSVANKSVRVSGNRVAAPTPAAHEAENRERYDGGPVSGILSAAEQPVSTFSVDVDTGAYSNTRRMLNDGVLPPQAAVRTEEFINYFRYDYPRPDNKNVPFSITSDVAQTPWNDQTRLLRIGLRGYDVTSEARPPANLVFLVDVSGSMGSPDKLDLVKKSLGYLAENLRADDTVSIVVYASTFGTLLEPTNNKNHINEALACMNAGGSTAGTNALQEAYDQARRGYKKDGVNRIFLATDGDFNVGVTDNDAIVDIVERERETGITLTSLGFGTGNYNEAMMERVADAGNGNYAYIDSEQEAQKVLSDELTATMFTIAGDVKIQVEFNPAYVSEYRLIGYENRALAEEDFNNDKVDAGDIGAGHQVTALYEIVPTGNKGWLPERRYSANKRTSGGADNNEMAFVKLRYKLPGEADSRLISQPVSAAYIRTARAPQGDFAFAASVAAFGQWLRADTHLGNFTAADLRTLAGEQTDPLRREFIKLTEEATKISPQ